MPENRTVFIPSGGSFYHPPLERFLPPLPTGVVSTWLEANTQPGDLIIDPLGANPLLALEAAHQGRRVLFSRNNPILWLILEVMASAPAADEVQNAINKLLLTRQGDQRLDELLESLYTTPCAECGQLIQADGFIWEQGASQPAQRVYQCPHCGDQGERPVILHDLDNLRRIGEPGLHQARALHRVMQSGDYERESIANALACYLPRAVFVVMTMINRLDGLDLSKTARQLVQAALVCVFDDATSLWHWPPKSHRILQLGPPARFLEKNLWLTINSCASLWQIFGRGIPVSYWPNLPDSEGGICLYQRKLAENEHLFAGQQPRAIITVFPRPNQAFWTLSALWSGWLWGRKAVAPMRSALSRRGYNWHWFSQAISSTMSRISGRPDSPDLAFGLLPQLAPNLYMGMLAGMHASGMRLEGAAVRLEAELAQCEWQAGGISAENPEMDFAEAISGFFRQRGEPADFQTILVHCLTQMALNSGLPGGTGAIDEGLFRYAQDKVAGILDDTHFAQVFKPSVSGPSRWWLADDRNCQPPLSERVEEKIRRLLLDRGSLDLLEMEKAVCSQFPGPLTPEEELIHICLESYASPSNSNPLLYKLMPSETTVARQQVLVEIEGILVSQGESFNFRVNSEDSKVSWVDSNGMVTMCYHLTITAAICQTVMTQGNADEVRHIIVFPGSRSRLLEYRLRQDPRLVEALESSWQFLKFRYLRWMVTRESLDLKLWTSLLGGDPPAWDPPKQLQFF